MESEKIKEYVLGLSEIEGPALQEHFGLSYGSVRSEIDKLVADGTLEYISGVSYRVNRADPNAPPKPKPVYVPKNATEKKFIEILGECIRFNVVGTSFIQQRCSVGFTTSTKALDWMEDNGFVTPFPSRKLKITAREYAERFGPLPGSDEDTTEGEERDGDLPPVSERFRHGTEVRRRMTDEDDDDGPVRKWRLSDFIEDDEDDDDDEEEDEDADLEDILGSVADGDGYSQSDASDDEEIKTLLSECILCGLKFDPERDVFTLSLGGEWEMQFKFINDGSDMRLSDDGAAVANSPCGRRRITNLLKSYPQVTLEGDELAVTVDSPTDTFMAVLRLYAAVDAVKRLK